MTVYTNHELNNPIGKQLNLPAHVGGLYDFAKMGGAVRDILLPVFIPPRSMVTRGYIVKKTALASGGSATLALKASSTGDVLAATAFDNAVFTGASANTKQLDSTGLTGRIVNDTDSSLQITLTIAGAALTAGKFALIFDCIPIPQLNV